MPSLPGLVEDAIGSGIVWLVLIGALGFTAGQQFGFGVIPFP